MTNRRFRLFDVSTAEKLSTLAAAAVENGLALSIDFLGPFAAVEGRWWTVQLFDEKDIIVLAARGKDLSEAVAELHERWMSRNGKFY